MGAGRDAEDEKESSPCEQATGFQEVRESTAVDIVGEVRLSVSRLGASTTAARRQAVWLCTSNHLAKRPPAHVRATATLLVLWL